jgi:ribosomal protein S18 acetylase RimI-like enzyme
MPDCIGTIAVTRARSEKSLRQIHELFTEYEKAIGIDLCFQNFDRELAQLPGDYAPPSGLLLLALAGDEPAGCAALRKIGEGICEMKRLYVRTAFRRRGAGRALAAAVIAAARRAGYDSMRLDTLASMKEATALYRSLGFQETAPYCHNPFADALYLELKLK